MHELSEFKTSCDIILEIENNSPWRWYDVIKAAKGLKQTDVMLCKLYQNSYPLKKHTQKKQIQSDSSGKHICWQSSSSNECMHVSTTLAHQLLDCYSVS